MQSKVFQKIAHPWLLGVSLLMVGLFAGAGIQMIKAQTTAFTDPTCNPGEACNPNVSTFLATSSTPQTIASDITYDGNFTLQSGSSILTAVGYAGIPINVASTSDHALVAGTTSTAHYAMQGNGIGAAGGVMGTTASGNAIYGKATTGLAGYFEGNVTLGRATTPTVTGISSNLTLAKGSLSVSDRATVKDIVALNSLEVNGSLIVNGQNVVSGSMQQVSLFASIPNTAGSNTKTFYATDITGSATSYRMMAIQVFGSNAGAATRTWIPVAAGVAGYTYTECSGGSFVGSLLITNTNPTFAPGSYRIVVTYQKVPVTCANADVSPPTAITITSPVSGGNVSGSTMNIVASATDPSTPITYNYFVNGTNVGNNTTGTLNNVPLSPYPYSPPKLTIYVTATDAQGNVGTSLPIQVNYVNNLCSPICGGIQTCQYVGCTGPTDYRCLNPDTFVDCGGPAT